MICKTNHAGEEKHPFNQLPPVPTSKGKGILIIRRRAQVRGGRKKKSIPHLLAGEENRRIPRRRETTPTGERAETHELGVLRGERGSFPILFTEKGKEKPKKKDKKKKKKRPKKKTHKKPHKKKKKRKPKQKKNQKLL